MLKIGFNADQIAELICAQPNLPYRNFKIPRHFSSRLRAMTPKILVLWRDEESPGARDGQGIAR
ncbi:hypothetical protein A2Y83_00040 [Candidatus Falkowbacteria bacterium RBG_13_39_14]|uniref:Uncharacterized protein n=1 Tax=Candidatus Falkowbacteria bacterium RBG_13_39_14 TaxID=1797985 RepID=A0A1F5S7M2_9BACT|nr:MAG: hypothetical protein A2Y83_00040 [Candidatus Falkowbacteria bacterium RBG_13_39_14]